MSIAATLTSTSAAPWIQVSAAFRTLQPVHFHNQGRKIYAPGQIADLPIPRILHTVHAATASATFITPVNSPTPYSLHFDLVLVDLMKMAQTQEKTGKGAKLKPAISEGAAACGTLHAAEYGKWKDFCTEGDWLLDFPRTLGPRAYRDRLERRPVSQNATHRG